MKTSINWKSRTVWTGIVMAGLGLGKVFFPEIVLIDGDPAMLISGGFAFVFLKS